MSHMTQRWYPCEGCEQMVDDWAGDGYCDRKGYLWCSEDCYHEHNPEEAKDEDEGTLGGTAAR